MLKTIIVTGANCGIGYRVTEMLAQAGGYDLVLACRNEVKGKEALETLKSLVPTVSASFMKLDLASLKSIHEFADAFHATGKPLHVLINNAGVMLAMKGATVQHTEDGFELTFGTNHLGHFLLTNLLIDDLKQTASKLVGDVRVVVLASELHDPDEVPQMGSDLKFPLELDNLQFEKAGTYNGLRAYSNSKLANVFFMYELARRLEGSGVTVTALTPGFIPQTGLARHSSGWTRFTLKTFMAPLLWLFNITRTLEHGSGMVFDLATKPQYKGVSGKYFQDYHEKNSSVASHDTEKGKKLWDVSADLVKYEAAKTL